MKIWNIVLYRQAKIAAITLLYAVLSVFLSCWVQVITIEGLINLMSGNGYIVGGWVLKQLGNLHVFCGRQMACNVLGIAEGGGIKPPKLN